MLALNPCLNIGTPLLISHNARKVIPNAQVKFKSETLSPTKIWAENLIYKKVKGRRVKYSKD